MITIMKYNMSSYDGGTGTVEQALQDLQNITAVPGVTKISGELDTTGSIIFNGLLTKDGQTLDMRSADIDFRTPEGGTLSLNGQVITSGGTDITQLEQKTQYQTSTEGSYSSTVFGSNMILNAGGNNPRAGRLLTLNDNQATSYEDATCHISFQGNNQEVFQIGCSHLFESETCHIAIRNDPFEIHNNRQLQLVIPPSGDISLPNTGLQVTGGDITTSNNILGADQPTNKIDLNSNEDVNIETSGNLKVNGQIIATDVDIDALEQKTQHITADVSNTYINGTLDVSGQITNNGNNISRSQQFVNLRSGNYNGYNLNLVPRMYIPPTLIETGMMFKFQYWLGINNSSTSELCRFQLLQYRDNSDTSFDILYDGYFNLISSLQNSSMYAVGVQVVVLSDYLCQITSSYFPRDKLYLFSTIPIDPNKDLHMRVITTSNDLIYPHLTTLEIDYPTQQTNK